MTGCRSRKEPELHGTDTISGSYQALLQMIPEEEQH